MENRFRLRTTLVASFFQVLTLSWVNTYMSQNNTFTSCNSIRDGKGLEFYKGHSPLASGARQAPHFTYIQHIRQVQQALTAPGALQAPQYIHILDTYDKCQALTARGALQAPQYIHIYTQHIQVQQALTALGACHAPHTHILNT